MEKIQSRGYQGTREPGQKGQDGRQSQLRLVLAGLRRALNVSLNMGFLRQHMSLNGFE